MKNQIRNIPPGTLRVGLYVGGALLVDARPQVRPKLIACAERLTARGYVVSVETVLKVQGFPV